MLQPGSSGMALTDIRSTEIGIVMSSLPQVTITSSGTPARLMAMTSSIVIHALDDMRQVYLNVFSCKDFDVGIVAAFVAQRFGGMVVTLRVVDRS